MIALTWGSFDVDRLGFRFGLGSESGLGLVLGLGFALRLGFGLGLGLEQFFERLRVRVSVRV